jgi:hypothetical protein
MIFYVETTYDNKFVLRMEREGIVSFVPADPGNMDYQAYLAWVAEGNTAEEWDSNDNQ